MIRTIKLQISRKFHLFPLAGCLLLCSLAAAEDGIEAVTKPSKDRTISFIRPGLIAGMLVKEGQDIRKGQLLAKLEDAAERVQLAQLKAKAEDVTLIAARQAALDQARVELKLKQKARKGNVATDLEVQQAQLQVEIAEAQLALANFEHDKVDQLRYNQMLLELDRMQLKSPIDGKVLEIFVNEGEAVDAQTKPVMRVIRIDPMWLDVKVPSHQAKRLKADGTAVIVFALGDDKKTTGTIINIDSHADSASDTVKVRVEAPNPSMRRTGETVRVVFPNKNNTSRGTKSVKPQTTHKAKIPNSGTTENK